ncbi:MAG TPA: hypothetical protein VK445_04860 [Dissulfurispiraceae bacterium]|nr:hypothetical protein [Dissulfurispiraceae bacterium]
MKRSRTITLTFLASATVFLTACSDDQATKRELYSTKERCVEDWGSEDNCEQTGSGRYHGPHYYWYSGRPYYFPRGGGDAQPARTGNFASLREGMSSSHSIGSISSSVSRGGFGRSSSFHGSGS